MFEYLNHEDNIISKIHDIIFNAFAQQFYDLREKCIVRRTLRLNDLRARNIIISKFHTHAHTREIKKRLIITSEYSNKSEKEKKT